MDQLTKRGGVKDLIAALTEEQREMMGEINSALILQVVSHNGTETTNGK